MSAEYSVWEVRKQVELRRCFQSLEVFKGSQHAFGEVYDHPKGCFVRWEDVEKYLATHPHSLDAADSGRVGDVSSRLRGLIAEIDHPKHPAASPDIKLIAGELRAIAALAAQGQGEAVAIAPSIEAAEAMGAKGGPVVEAERLAFEAWMRGHCGALCATWNGTGYRSDAEQGGNIDPHAMKTRGLWAAWRDRAALAAPPASPAGVPDSVERCMHGCYCGCCQACKNGSCEPVKYTACDCIAAAPSAPEGGEVQP